MGLRGHGRAGLAAVGSSSTGFGNTKLGSLSHGFQVQAAHGMAMGLAGSWGMKGWVWGCQYMEQRKRKHLERGNGQRFSFLCGECRLVKLSLLFL